MKDRQKAFIGVFVLLVAVGLGAWQWSVRQAHVLQTNVLNTEVINLTNQKNELVSRYQDVKTEVTETRSTETEQLKVVFPTDEALTDLTRAFDDFEVKNNFDTNPFIISNISYSTPTEQGGESYRYIPVSLEIETSKTNLEEFLEFIEASGALESETRLMSVEEMTVRYPEEIGGTYGVTFMIYAYFSQEL